MCLPCNNPVSIKINLPWLTGDLLLWVVTHNTSHSCVQRKTKCYCEGPNINEKRRGFVLFKANLPSYIYLYIQYIYVLRLTFLCSVLISCVLLCSTSVLTVFLYNLMLLIILHFVCRCATVSCFNTQVLTINVYFLSRVGFSFLLTWDVFYT